MYTHKNENKNINQFVLDKLFDTKIRDNTKQDWQKLYLVVSHSIDPHRSAADYLCHIITFDPRKALNTFKNAQDFRKHPDFMCCPFINVYYVPPTFSFKSTDRYVRIKEWFEMNYPSYQDITIPYEKQAHAKCIATFSIDKIENKTDYDDLMENMIDMFCANNQHWWSDIKEIYSPDDFYGNYNTEKFEVIKSDNCVCKKVYSIVTESPEADIQLLAITYSFKDALSKVYHLKKNHAVMILCHYFPFDFKPIEQWNDDDIFFIESEFPDEVYTLGTLEWMGLLA